jgi:hypothetical protein
VTKVQINHLLKSISTTLTPKGYIILGGSQAVFFSQELQNTINKDKESFFGNAYQSQEIDVFLYQNIKNKKDILFFADNVDGIFGEESYFHNSFGYYGQGIEEDTLFLPHNWEYRLEKTGIEHVFAIGFYDCLIAKCVAGREKDKFFIQEMLPFIEEPKIISLIEQLNTEKLSTIGYTIEDIKKRFFLYQYIENNSLSNKNG